MQIYYCPKRPKGKRFRVGIPGEMPSKYAKSVPWERIQQVARMLNIEGVATLEGEKVASMLNDWHRNPWFDKLKRWFRTSKSPILKGLVIGLAAVAAAVALLFSKAPDEAPEPTPTHERTQQSPTP